MRWERRKCEMWEGRWGYHLLAFLDLPLPNYACIENIIIILNNMWDFMTDSDSRRIRRLDQRAAWTSCSQICNISRITQQQLDALLIRKSEQIGVVNICITKNFWRKSVEEQVRYVWNNDFRPGLSNLKLMWEFDITPFIKTLLCILASFPDGFPSIFFVMQILTTPICSDFLINSASSCCWVFLEILHIWEQLVQAALWSNLWILLLSESFIKSHISFNMIIMFSIHAYLGRGKSRKASKW